MSCSRPASSALADGVVLAERAVTSAAQRPTARLCSSAES